MTIFWAKSLPACAPLLSLRAKPCRFARLQILSFNPFTGNGIYEKTPRCPGGWSVGCKCFCTGACSRSGPRPCSPSAHGCTRCTCSCSPRRGVMHIASNSPATAGVFFFRSFPLLLPAGSAPLVRTLPPCPESLAHDRFCTCLAFFRCHTAHRGRRAVDRCCGTAVHHGTGPGRPPAEFAACGTDRRHAPH